VSVVRRLDHVAVAVRDSRRASRELHDRLGLEVVHSEELSRPRVRLTYLDVGNGFIQLVEPLDGTSDVARWLDEHGEGVHHVCFGVDDVADAVARIGGGARPERLGTGRGRPSAFVPEPIRGMRVECTGFSRGEDVERSAGWLQD
jgi:methylmalonyl-CoA/ethylmalonyl-CoA epimerase